MASWYVVQITRAFSHFLSDDSSATTGLQRVGSNEQILAMQLGTTLNSTFIPDGDKVCKNDGTTDEPPGKFGCIFWRGGLFQPAKSSSWLKDTGVVPYNGSVRNEGWDYLHQDMYTRMYTAKPRISDGMVRKTNGL